MNQQSEFKKKKKKLNKYAGLCIVAKFHPYSEKELWQKEMQIPMGTGLSGFHSFRIVLKVV